MKALSEVLGGPDPEALGPWQVPGRSLGGPCKAPGKSKKTGQIRAFSNAKVGVHHAKGELTGNQRPAGLTAQPWDWELCRPPEGFGLQSCLGCRARRVRPAQRPRAHSV